jgi:hypothetical protein
MQSNMLGSHRHKVNTINVWRSEFKIDYGYIDYYDQYSEDVINQIYDLIIDNKVDTNSNDNTYNRYVGYYFYFRNALDEMKKYFQKGVENGDSQSMLDLAKNYIYLEEDKIKSKELLNRSIALNNLNSMYCLAIIYMNNLYNEDEEFSKKEATRLFDKLIELKYHEAMNYLGNYYLTKNPVKSREYFKMMNDTGYIYGNFGIIKLGVSKETEKELIAEIIEKWDTNRCTFPNMDKFITILSKHNFDTKFLLEHTSRFEFESNDLRYKLQIQETILKNKMKYVKHEECPICLEEKELIPYDCFAHFFCVNCEKRINKCSLCRISRNQLLD